MHMIVHEKCEETKGDKGQERHLEILNIMINVIIKHKNEMHK